MIHRANLWIESDDGRHHQVFDIFSSVDIRLPTSTTVQLSFSTLGNMDIEMASPSGTVWTTRPGWGGVRFTDLHQNSKLREMLLYHMDMRRPSDGRHMVAQELRGIVGQPMKPRHHLPHHPDCRLWGCHPECQRGEPTVRDREAAMEAEDRRQKAIRDLANGGGYRRQEEDGPLGFGVWASMYLPPGGSWRND